MRLNHRWMIRRDLPEVLAIEAASFDRPWGEDEFRRRLRGRWSLGFVVADCSAAAVPVVGFILYDLGPGRLILRRLAVRPDRRREGIGRAMLDRLALKLSPDRRPRIATAIPERNLAGQKFLACCKYRAVKVLRNHFGDEDAYLFEYLIGERAEAHCSGIRSID